MILKVFVFSLRDKRHIGVSGETWEDWVDFRLVWREMGAARQAEAPRNLGKKAAVMALLGCTVVPSQVQASLGAL